MILATSPTMNAVGFTAMSAVCIAFLCVLAREYRKSVEFSVWRLVLVVLACALATAPIVIGSAAYLYPERPFMELLTFVSGAAVVYSISLGIIMLGLACQLRHHGLLGRIARGLLACDPRSGTPEPPRRSPVKP